MAPLDNRFEIKLHWIIAGRRLYDIAIANSLFEEGTILDFEKAGIEPCSP